MSKRSLPSIGRDLFGLPALLLFALFTTILYWRAFSSGVIGDGWVMLEIGRRGIATAPFVLLSYHFIPVANLFIALLWKLFQLHEAAYQALNLLELALVGWLVARLGRRLFAEARVGLLAGLLFLANSSFYDVPLWPVIGNFHSLAAMFYLAALFALRTEKAARRNGLFALFTLLGFFTYEPTLSVLAAGALLVFFSPFGEASREAGPIDWRGGLGRVRALLPALLGVPAVVLASKVWASRRGSVPFFVPHGAHAVATRAFLLVRASIALFTLRGADPALQTVFAFGRYVPHDSRGFLALVAAWLLAFGALAAWLIAKGSPAVRFLAAWLTVHLLMVAAGIEMVSRHFYLAALPASLLAARALWRGAEGVIAVLARRYPLSALGLSAEQAGFFVLLLPLTLLLAGSSTDLDAAAAVHREATAATRAVGDLVARRLREDPSPRVVLVNMPAILVRDGMAAFTFGNGLQEQLLLVFGDRLRGPLLAHTYSTGAQGNFAGTSREITLSGLGSLVREPGNLVLRFDFDARRVVEITRAAWTLPRDYLRETAPILEWQPGEWPWLRLAAGAPLELPLAAPPEGAWLALRYLRHPDTRFALAAGTAGDAGDAGEPPLLAVEPRGGPPAWTVALLPAPPMPAAAATAAPLRLRLRPRSEVWLGGLWSFAPPADYTPEAAPFLAWNFRPFAAFSLTDPIRLPLAAPAAGMPAGTIRLEVLAEPGRSFALALGDGPARSFDFSTLAVPEWRTLDVPTPPGRQAVLRLVPQGPLPVVVKRLGWSGEPGANAGSLQLSSPWARIGDLSRRSS
jgi:hypothetical protein